MAEQTPSSLVKDLIEAGIHPGRLTARGLGEDDPMAPNTTREGRALNRRVDLLPVR